MSQVKELLKGVFEKLNDQIKARNQENREDGLPLIAKARVRILGQISLLVHERVSAILSLAHTGDLDALLSMDHSIKNDLKALLREQGLIYDEDSYLVWIAPGAKFDVLFDFENVHVEAVDPESALVSKAVKAPGKNKQLIREAIASGEFPGLVDRIVRLGGKLEDFA
jgi:hypothetical protein